MDTIEKMQLKERTSGTLLRLGWLMGIAAFVPMLLYIAYGAMAVAKLLYVLILIIVAMATAFLILLNEGFRNAFNAQSADFMPMVQKVYQGYSVLIYVFLILGIAFGILTVLLAVKEGNGKSSRKKIISSGCMMAFLVIAVIVYTATKSKVVGASV